ncbi:hypothetical protein C4K04_3102 [Pseudomonas chlororaphis]|uniref:Uncharacterized protein n=1 Tax=Pseudomonas chlororaphis TaxID=587753 RepID=A0A3G7TNR9_9PSED|nr:hypothetical protein C4K04_3102 [Pseudomonas chlororaphis]
MSVNLNIWRYDITQLICLTGGKRRIQVMQERHHWLPWMNESIQGSQ